MTSVLTEASDLAAAYTQYTAQGLLYEPVLLISLTALYALAPWIKQLSYRAGVAFILGMVAFIVLALQWGLHAVLPGQLLESVLHSVLLAVGVTGFLLFYLNWRHLRLSPSLVESRLMALQARIRPHFLFNTLNSVLGLIRDDPKRAEAMLENLADLFRAVMADPRALVPFSQELEMAKAYVAIEEIRFGSRLRVNWCCNSAPRHAMMPPLILQPLVENAVLHGVAPVETGAVISVEAYEDDGNLMILVRNSLTKDTKIRGGNGIALENISERLALHFDVEAHLKVSKVKGEYVVTIRIPIQRERST